MAGTRFRTVIAAIIRVSAICGCLECGLILLLAHVAAGDEPDRGPPFPRIANVYGTAFTKDGTSFHGDDRTLEEAARYDLLIGVQRRQGSDPDGKEFRRHLEELKKINPYLIALHFACSAPYTHIAPTEEILAARQPGQIVPWLLQTDGKPIAGWPGTYMLNMAAPGVIDGLRNRRYRRCSRSATTASSSTAWGPTSTVGPAKSPPASRIRRLQRRRQGRRPQRTSGSLDQCQDGAGSPHTRTDRR